MSGQPERPPVRKLSGSENYIRWKRDMRGALVFYDVWDIVSGRQKRPEIPQPGLNLEEGKYLSVEGKSRQDWEAYQVANERFNDWSQSDAKAASLIKRYLSDRDWQRTRNLHDSKEIWDALQDAYQGTLVYNAMGIFEQLIHARVSDFKSADEYVSMINEYALDLEELGWPVPGHIRAYFMFSGLNEKYDLLRQKLRQISIDSWDSVVVSRQIRTFGAPDRPKNAVAPVVGKRKRHHSNEKNNHTMSHHNVAYRNGPYPDMSPRNMSPSPRNIPPQKGPPQGLSPRKMSARNMSPSPRNMPPQKGPQGLSPRKMSARNTSPHNARYRRVSPPGISTSKGTKCPYCKMTNHKGQNCWFRHPEKRPRRS
ncbi:hypothetical protein Egran_06404 [Elaphomyces granulatus]|uniref:Retrotransposon Copia-like N-terminal domain-containing protein n=1 Tax=Elaphomyces granulatus TaxID=519963 RepID=A0A232LP91_9EURO|nr:hypothetical protein Egran_06404 [Elaphomyces granulatus]